MLATLMRTLPLLLAAVGTGMAAGPANRPERLEWFRDQGFGLFIHWSVDSQTGVVISHSMVGADEPYLDRFINLLPRTFNPRKFYPQDMAALARLAGIRYVVFTTKHHSGFCMWDTATTDFNIMRTPYGRDITGELLKAFRTQGIAPGMYFSPDDFWWLYKNKKVIQRGIPDVQPSRNPGLLQHNRAQIRELLTRYGTIDVMFFDGEAEGQRELAWEIQPNIVVTRGAMQTPEQYVPGVPLEGAWEACLTMGTAWQYQPQNENYKSGGQVISLLVETRAKGGNLLMNVGPKPDGELPIEQEERLREVALWMMVNQECIYGVRPWVLTNEGDIWFTRRKNSDTLYAVVKEKEVWKRGEWKDFVLRSVQATADTRVSVLGQNDLVYEYQPRLVPRTTFRQEADGLHIRAFRSQRLQDNSKWPNPAVLKITGAKPALTPPRVVTLRASRDRTGVVLLEGSLEDLGNAKAVEVAFEYRSLKGLDVHERSGAWQRTPFHTTAGTGTFSARVTGWEAAVPYEYRAVVKHPVLTIYGEGKRVTLR